MFRGFDVYFDYILLGFPDAWSTLHTGASRVVIVRSITFAASFCLRFKIPKCALRMVILPIFAVP